MDVRLNNFLSFIKGYGKGMIYISNIIALAKRLLIKKQEEKNINKEQKEIFPISNDILEKILKKVNNRLLILFANLFDYSQNLEDKSSDYNKFNSEIYLKTESDSSPSPRKINYIKKLLGSKQIYDQILNEEIEIVKKHGFTKDQYVYSIQNSSSENIKKHIEFLINFRHNLEQNRLMDIDFGENFTKNYLKLISNIYFINLKKTQQIFKSNYINQKFFFKNFNHLNDVLSDIYSKNLKQTRNEVCEFFQIKNDKHLDIKVLIRLYYYYLKPYDEVRIRMDEYVIILNDIMANLSWGFEFPLLEKSCGKPKDEIIELLKILDNKIENKSDMEAFETELIETDNSTQEKNVVKDEILNSY